MTVKSAKQTPPSPLPFFCQLRPKQFCFGSRSLSNFSEWCFLGKLSIQAFYSDIIFTTPWTSFELKIVVTFLKVFTNITTFCCFKDNEKKSKSQKSSLRKKLEKTNKQKALKIVMQEDKPNRTIIFFPSKVVKTTRGRWEEECNKKIYEFRVPNISKKICFLPQNFSFGFAVFCFPFHYICRWDAWKLKAKDSKYKQKILKQNELLWKWFETERILQIREPKIGPFFKKKFTAALQNNTPVDLLSIWGKKFAWDITK